jgi:hypothetical protein
MPISRARADQIRPRSIDADCRQQERERAKGGDDTARETRLGSRARDQGFERRDLIDLRPRFDRSDNIPHDVDNGLGAPGALDQKARAARALLCPRHEDVEGRRLPDRMKLDVFHHADDLAPGDVVDVRQPQRFTNRKPSRPEHPRGAFADDHHAALALFRPVELRFAEAIGGAERAPADEPDAHQYEVPVSDVVLHARPPCIVIGRLAAASRQRRRIGLR